MPHQGPALATAALLALGAVGCSPAPSGAPAALSTPEPVPAAADPGPLPAPAVLTDVMSRLADPAVPGAEKFGLVADATPLEAGTLDRFAAALRDGGFAPPVFAAGDIRWATPPTVVATITVSPADPAGPAGSTERDDFSFPMEFRATPEGWQLTRETAEMLLAFGDAATPNASPPR